MQRRSFACAISPPACVSTSTSLASRKSPGAIADFTRVDRERCSIFLCRDGQGLGRAWAWIGVTDTAALHEQLIARNIAIRMPPTNYFYALEMHLEDPDGNVLRLGSDPLTDQPFSEYIFPQ